MLLAALANYRIYFGQEGSTIIILLCGDRFRQTSPYRNAIASSKSFLLSHVVLWGMRRS
jgi:putative component of toxin-antitoxin plasmid stabilization module